MNIINRECKIYDFKIICKWFVKKKIIMKKFIIRKKDSCINKLLKEKIK